MAVLADYELIAIQEDDPVQPQLWTAHFPTASERNAVSEAIRRDQEFQRLNIQSIDVEDDDWARRTQADLPAVRIGRVTVAPPWDIPQSARRTANDVVVIIEPSRGFGTGHHQSTRLCLALLQSRELTGLTMIDVGTGSGVLAITAAKLGAAFVSAIDVDPDAVENARENIAANDVGENVEAHTEDFTTSRRSPADLVTANLTGSLLARYPAELARLVRPTGALIVSGFNVEEREMVASAFAPMLSVIESAEEDGWCAFVLNYDRRAA